MAAVTIFSDSGAPKMKSITVSTVSHLFPMKWWDQMPWFYFSECWALSQIFHSLLSLSSRGSLVLCVLHKSSVICVPEIIDIYSCSLDSSMCFIQPWNFTWCTLNNLNKQGDNIQPCHTPSLIWIQSVVLCPVLTVASWPANRFLRRQVMWSGIPISLRIFHSLWCSAQSKALALSIKQK